MSVATTLKKIDREIQYHHNAHSAVYAIRHGDTLAHILTDYYKISKGSPQYQTAVDFAMYYNPHITRPEHLKDGDIIRLMPLPKPSFAATCPIPDDFYTPRQILTRHRLEPARSHHSAFLRRQIPINKEQRDIFMALARVQDKYHWLEMSTFGAASFAHISGAGNTNLILQVGDAYEQFKSGKISQSQYTKQRKVLLDKFADNTRIMQRFFFNGETVHEAVRIKRQKALPATSRITANATKLNHLSKLAKGGGVILAGMGAAVSCENISNTEDRQEKNEIFVEFLASSSVSSATGVALGLFFISTPVGWAAALAIGGATIATGWAAGKGAKKLYDSQFKEYDFVKMSNIDKWCN